jgi:hypothetical protein
MHPSEIVDRLEAVEPLRLRAISLLLEMDDALGGDVLDTDELSASWEELERGVEELRQQARKGEEMRRRCEHLKPVPSRTPPLGF